MRLQLDSKALEALFPEGSEARVHLQSAVIQSFANRYIKCVADEELKKLDSKIREEVQRIIAKDGLFTYQMYKGYVVSDTYKNKLKNAINEEVDDIIKSIESDVNVKMRKVAYETVENKTAELKVLIESKLDKLYNSHFENIKNYYEGILDSKVTDYLRKRFDEIISKFKS